jgi:5-methylthioadenosine/S-adenosylhomocysteine deaminase
MSRIFRRHTTQRGETENAEEARRKSLKMFSLRFLCVLCVSAVSLCAESADWIWSARYVITEDAQHRVIANGAMAIRGDSIVGVGTRAEIDARFQAKQRLDRPDAILAPGLINTHTHAAMSLFRGIADDLKLQDWLEKFIFPAEAKNVSAEFVRWGTRLGCLEMLLGGTTTYTDM